METPPDKKAVSFGETTSQEAVEPESAQAVGATPRRKMREVHERHRLQLQEERQRHAAELEALRKGMGDELAAMKQARAPARTLRAF